MRRELDHQGDFSQLFLPEEVGRDDVLARVDGLVDWVALEAACGDIYATPLGRPSYPLRVLIKAMLVQAWWNRSDPKAARLLWNDLRFRCFLGIGLTGKTLDRNTLWRFDAWASPAARDELWKRGLAERLLGEVDRRLRARGFVMRRGSTVDAPRLRSAVSSNNRRKEGTAVEPAATGRHRTGEIPSWATSAMRRWTRTPGSCAGSPSRRHPATIAAWRRRWRRRIWGTWGPMRRTMPGIYARGGRRGASPR